ncbi:MAG TPA: VanZ family protein [Chitinophagaceae bacterium]|nr:VanZ family protein [Chitinophagaceae bacterium]
MKSRRIAYTWSLGWLILTIVLLTLPGSSFPKANWYNKVWLDKWIHVFLFFILVMLWCRAFSGNKKPRNQYKKIFFLIMIAGICYGAGMEFVQKFFIPNRSFDGGDILADAAGCGIGLVYSISRYIKK